MLRLLRRYRSAESGMAAVEYGLIAVLLVVAMLGGLRILGTTLGSRFTLLSSQFN